MSISTPSLEQAIEALTHLAGTSTPHPDTNAALMLTFLNALKARAAHDLHLELERDGFILEGAMQHGFEPIDDDAKLFVVHGNDIIKFVNMNRQSAVRTALQQVAREQLPLPAVALSTADDLTLSRLVLEFAQAPVVDASATPVRLRRHVMDDLRKLLVVARAAMGAAPMPVKTTKQQRISGE